MTRDYKRVQTSTHDWMEIVDRDNYCINFLDYERFAGMCRYEDVIKTEDY